MTEQNHTRYVTPHNLYFSKLTYVFSVKKRIAMKHSRNIINCVTTSALLMPHLARSHTDVAMKAVWSLLTPTSTFLLIKKHMTVRGYFHSKSFFKIMSVAQWGTNLANRYTCVHLSCSTAGQEGSRRYFPTWSSLQSHIKKDHPPTCPHQSCNGKAFSNSGNLRAHLKLHENCTVDAVLKRGDEGAGLDDDAPPRKRQRGGEYGRDWKCDKDDCAKDFSSVLLFFCFRSTCVVLIKSYFVQGKSTTSSRQGLPSGSARFRLRPWGLQSNLWVQTSTATPCRQSPYIWHRTFRHDDADSGWIRKSSTKKPGRVRHWRDHRKRICQTGGGGQVEGAVPLSGIDWFALRSRDPIDSGPECCPQTMRFCLFSSVRSKAPPQCLPWSRYSEGRCGWMDENPEAKLKQAMTVTSHSIPLVYNSKYSILRCCCVQRCCSPSSPRKKCSSCCCCKKVWRQMRCFKRSVNVQLLAAHVCCSNCYGWGCRSTRHVKLSSPASSRTRVWRDVPTRG